MQLAIADVEGDHPAGAALQQAIGETPGGGSDVEAVELSDLDSEHVEGVSELLAAAGDEPRRSRDVEHDGLVHLRARLRVAGDEPGHHHRLRLRAALGEPALDE